MSLCWLLLCAVGLSAFEVALKPVASSYRFTLWNSEPLSLAAGELTEIEPEPINNIQYIANISVGSPQQELSFIVTTGSPWIIVSTPECGDCFSNRDFNRSKSRSFRGSKRMIILDEFEASLGEDNITFPAYNNISVSSQKLLLVHKSPYLSNIQAEGVLGLAYNKLLWDDMGLLENMKRQKFIEKMVFAVHLFTPEGKTDGRVADSAISFGEWNLAKYARGEFAFMRLASEPGVWKVLLNSAKFGNIELVDGYSTVAIELGTSLIIVPNEVYLQIEYELCWQHTCLFNENLISFKCDVLPSDMPNLRLFMDGKEVTFTPEMYMQVGNGKCQVLMTSYNSNSWIIGTMLFKRYYALFDMEEHRIGLAPSVNIPTSGPWWILWIGLTVLVILGGSYGGYLYWKRQKEKRRKKREEEEGYAEMHDEQRS